ncbi:MAG: phenylalanine--tRNA ligase subunit beta [Pseudomonadota bacterium]
MKFTLSWLKRHLDTTATLDEIVDTMVEVGLEVESVDNPADRLAAFSIGEVLTAEKHPDADKLKVCTVATKDGEKQIVCGAPNARAGIKVAYAPVGAYVPGIDVTLSKAKIRGVESFGMMCSVRELEMGDDHDGIIEAPAYAAVGAPVAEVMGVNDPVIDFEVTPNRPDTNGVNGVARDLAAAGLGTLITPTPEPVAGVFDSPVSVDLQFTEDTADACPVFVGRYIRGVKNGPSPKWLQDQLRAVGLRPINALVDMTNFISLDRARPLHVFDADKLSGTVHARLGKTGEKFLALDGKDYTVDETMTVIADESGALGLGGIMGGEDTGCTDETTNVFIECAYFDPLRTAKTGRKTGINSDARYRFERGVDPGYIEPGMEQATRMVLDLCGGEASTPVVSGSIPVTEKIVDFPPAEVLRLTGVEVSEDRMMTILTALGFAVEDTSPAWRVTAPSWRPDIEGKADIVEEIIRIVGFEALPTTTLPIHNAVEMPKITAAQNRRRLARRALAARGLDEAVTWSFTEESQAALFSEGADWLAAQGLKLANPISADLGVMRPSILPNLLAAMARNKDRGVFVGAGAAPGLFEVAPIYFGDAPDGQMVVATGVRLPVPTRHWSGGSAGEASAPDVYTVKADCLAALAAAGAPVASLQTTADAPKWFHPGRSGVLRLGPKTILAEFGEIHPRVLKAMDIEGPIYGFEIALDQIPGGKAKATKTRPALALSDLLPLTRDFAFILDEGVAAETLLKAVRGADKKLIDGVTLFDIYQGKGVPDGKKSLAIEVKITPRDQTLTDEQIEALSAKIIAQVEKATGALLRG